MEKQTLTNDNGDDDLKAGIKKFKSLKIQSFINVV